MSVEEHIRAHITTHGPIPIFDFMKRALYDPAGYYATKVPVGRDGDYMTAPEMTQVFGEVVATWLLHSWEQAGKPQPVHLIELGPGRGTLMADILRTFTAFGAKMPVHLVEVSPTLKALQRQALAPYSDILSWHKTMETLPTNQGYGLIIANEFWDALPIQQFVKEGNDWIERKVGIVDNDLVFLPQNTNEIREFCPLYGPLVTQIAKQLQNGGAALFFDYGYDEPHAIGDTLQALHHHKRVSPLAHVSQADLTHHVDFHRLHLMFQEAGLATHGPTAQGDFLKAMGFEARTEKLCAKAAPHQRSPLLTAAMRLTHPSHMGTLFKVLGVTTPRP